MRSALLAVVASLLVGGCAEPNIERIRAADLTGAMAAFESNLRAIHARDVEGYLSHYLESPELVMLDADSLRSGFLLFAEARRADRVWPDTLIAGRPRLVWVAPGVVWGAYPYTVVQGGVTGCGWSERLFVKTGGAWKIKVTGVMERDTC